MCSKDFKGKEGNKNTGSNELTSRFCNLPLVHMCLDLEVWHGIFVAYCVVN